MARGISSVLDLTVSPTSSVEAVTARIRDLIRQHHLEAGDALPPERELAERFGVSRNTIRESYCALEAYGAIERKSRGAVVAAAGVGILLKAATFQIALDRETYIDVQNFRRMVELGHGDAILQTVTPADIDDLRRINNSILDDVSVQESAVRDFMFHVRLMACSGNQTVTKVFTALSAQLQNVMQQGKDRGGRLITIKAHERILDALDQGVPDALRRAFEGHYEDSLIALRHLPERGKPTS